MPDTNVVDFINPFDTTLVQEPLVVPAATVETVVIPPVTKVEDTPAPVIPPKEEDDIFDEVQYVKNTFGWDSVEAGKAEIARLKKLEEQPVTFANADSEAAFNYLKEGKLEDLHNLLDRKIRLSKADTLDAKNAIALHLRATKPHYTDQDIQDVLEETYPTPTQPKQGAEEDPAAFEDRTKEWQAAVEKINRRINRDSLAAKDELKKLHSELILPDINRVDPKLVQEATQKELEATQRRERYLQAVESDYIKVDGFKTTYKDKEVEIPLSYELTPEEKVAYKEKIKSIDLQAYFGPRWFKEDGSPMVDKIMHDIYRLENEEKITQKLVNDAGSKRMDAYLKGKKNIDLGGKGTEGTFTPDAKAATEKALGEWAFSA
jgi:hypothetical protein